MSFSSKVTFHDLNKKHSEQQKISLIQIPNMAIIQIQMNIFTKNKQTKPKAKQTKKMLLEDKHSKNLSVEQIC